MRFNKIYNKSDLGRLYRSSIEPGRNISTK